MMSKTIRGLHFERRTPDPAQSHFWKSMHLKLEFTSKGKVGGFGRLFSTIRLTATDPRCELGSVEGNACIFAPDHSLITSPVRG